MLVLDAMEFYVAENNSSDLNYCCFWAAQRIGKDTRP